MTSLSTLLIRPSIFIPTFAFHKSLLSTNLFRSSLQCPKRPCLPERALRVFRRPLLSTPKRFCFTRIPFLLSPNLIISSTITKSPKDFNNQCSIFKPSGFSFDYGFIDLISGSPGKFEQFTSSYVRSFLNCRPSGDPKNSFCSSCTLRKHRKFFLGPQSFTAIQLRPFAQPHFALQAHQNSNQ